MLTRIVTTFTLGLALFLCVGCSFDAVSIIDHPAQVSKGQQFEVSLYNQFQHVTNSGKISMDIIRDSLHIAVGTPAGWIVESARFYVARDWDIISTASQLSDSVAVALALRDSSIAFKSRAAAMTADAGFAAILAGKSYQAADKYNGNEIQVETDAIDSWTCFTGFTNILYTQGAPVDTLTVDTSGDTTGAVVMPVFAWVTLRAPSNARQDTLIYFSKTAAMTEDTASFDIGEMAYSAIAVGTATDLSSKTVSKEQGITVRAPTGRNRITIDLGARAHEVSALGIYSLSGALIADLSPLLRRSTGIITWDAPGGAVKSGMYVLRCRTNKGIVSQAVQVMR